MNDPDYRPLRQHQPAPETPPDRIHPPRRNGDSERGYKISLNYAFDNIGAPNGPVE